MTTSATQSGVQAEETTETTTTAATEATTEAAAQTTDAPPALSDREKVMEQITAQNEQRIVDEHKKEGLTIEGLAAQEAAAEPATDQVAAQMDADKPTVLDAGLDKIFVRQKVDGVERLVSLADLNRDSQKNAAADKRLEEASRLLREAQAASQNPPVRVDGTTSTPDSATQTQAEGEDPKAVAQRLVKSLFEGDEEAALEAVERIVAGRQQTPTQPDTQQLAQVVKQQLSVDSALEQFEKSYPDIMSDPHLEQMTAGFIDAEMEGGKSFIEALEPAAKRTRDWLAAKTGQTPPNPTPTMDRTQKLERKAGIDNIQALNTKATTVEEPIPTASDVIADMKKSRGLA